MAIKENDDDSKHTTSNAEGLALRVAVVCMLARRQKTHASTRQLGIAPTVRSLRVAHRRGGRLAAPLRKNCILEAAT